MAKDKLICNCKRTMPLDGQAIGRALKLDATPRVNTELCRRHLATFEAAVKNGNDLVVACTQEAPLFTELHGELKGSGTIQFVNIRENAGWSGESSRATPKIAALLALADLPEPEPVPLVAYRSAGELLIVGPAARALPWAEQLAAERQVALLLTDSTGKEAPVELPAHRRYPVWSGREVAVRGYLGAFEIEWKQANPIDLEACTRCNACIRVCPEQAIDYSYQIDLDKCKAHRKCVTACGDIGAIDFERAETGRSERFDLVLDLNDVPLMDVPQLPQGYFAPGADAHALARAVRELTQLTGEFEKPKFFEYREKICAHGRNEITGCTSCIDVCSTRAIASEIGENRVTVEPHLCMGCGGCATVCPSGAMTYAYPRVADAGLRVKTVLQVYRQAGGEDACLLLHDGGDGRELIARMARRGKGLPAHVIPLEVLHIASLGLDLMLGAVALGAAQFVIVSAGGAPAHYHRALERQMGYAQEILTGLDLGADRFRLLEAHDPASLERALWALPRPRALAPAPFNLSNEKRATLDFVFDHLLRQAPSRKPEVALSAGAPYGQVVVDKQKCTMCLACVGACPEGALLDSKDKPQLRFIERNCVQCGLCEKTCPENAISLVPRLRLAADATQAVVVNEDQVFACVRCGKPFANQRIIDNMVARLAGHSMFREPTALKRLQMCQDCRVIDMFENGGGTIFDRAREGGR